MMKHITTLQEEFKRLRARHGEATKLRVARSVCGSSVIRVFKPDTKPGLLKVLARLPIDELPRLKPQDFDRWYSRQLSRVAREVRRLNASNRRILPGLKWGHSAKVLSLYLRDIVFHTRYFRDADVRRIGAWLPVPIDGILIRRLASLGTTMPFERIREIDSAAKFRVVQRTLADAAESARVPRVWFDDNWAERRETPPRNPSPNRTTRRRRLRAARSAPAAFVR